MNTDRAQIDAWLWDASEGQHLEFKEAKTQYDFGKLLKYCVALGNEGGGKLVLGVSDRVPREVVGTIAYPDLQDLQRKLLSKLHIRIDVEEISYETRRLLVLHVPGRPLNGALSVDGCYWMRCGEDLVAMTQVKLPDFPKLELARNYWDEMGRGNVKGMHGPMLGQLVTTLDLSPAIETTAWESLALANAMTAMATQRCYAWHSVGALGVIELTAPGRSAHTARALRRIGLSQSERRYFDLHAVLDVKHSRDWNALAIKPLVAEDPRRAAALAEGALMRLSCGERCFARYRRHFGLA